MTDDVRIGMNGRFFPGNWRPATEEITFARGVGFRALQFRGPVGGLTEADTGASFAVVGDALHGAGIEAVMEILVGVDEIGRTRDGAMLYDTLAANLPAITAFPCSSVHWHLVPFGGVADDTYGEIGARIAPDCARGVALAATRGFRFAIEHNEPRIGLLSTPEACAALLDAVPDLGFVWDINHATPEQVPGYLALAPRMTMLHIADTRLPTVNDHLPLGMGNVPLADYCREVRARGFAGPAILEIGGLPQSGGYERDTDDTLRDSFRRFGAALAAR